MAHLKLNNQGRGQSTYFELERQWQNGRGLDLECTHDASQFRSWVQTIKPVLLLSLEFIIRRFAHSFNDQYSQENKRDFNIKSTKIALKVCDLYFLKFILNRESNFRYLIIDSFILVNSTRLFYFDHHLFYYNCFLKYKIKIS